MKYSFRVFTLAIILLCSMATYAQDSSMPKPKMSPEQLAQLQTMQFKKRLSLTADQELKVTPILIDYYKKLMPLKNAGGRKMKKMKKAKQFTKDKDHAMKEILSEQQYKDYEKLMEEQKEKIKEKRAEKKGTK